VSRRFGKLGLGYVLTASDIAVSITVDRLSRQRGELHGEISVACGLPGIRAADGHVHQARFNLSGSTARTTLARILQHRADAPGDRLAGPARGLLPARPVAEREGDPVTKVGALPIPLATLYRVDPLLPDDQATILYGEGGTGKSTLACVAIAVSVETGVSVIEGWIPRQAPSCTSTGRAATPA
jgi:hypothetical protein